MELDAAFVARPGPERGAVWDAVARAVPRAPRTALVLFEADSELSAVLRERHELARCFVQYLRFPTYPADELAELAHRRLTGRGYQVDKATRAALTAQLAGRPPTEGAWGAHRFADRIVERAKSPNLRLRGAPGAPRASGIPQRDVQAQVPVPEGNEKRAPFLAGAVPRHD